MISRLASGTSKGEGKGVKGLHAGSALRWEEFGVGQKKTRDTSAGGFDQTKFKKKKKKKKTTKTWKTIAERQFKKRARSGRVIEWEGGEESSLNKTPESTCWGQ